MIRPAFPSRRVRTGRCLVQALGALLLSLAALSAHAESYRVDLIVFLQGGTGGETAVPATAPSLAHVIDPDNAEATRAAGIHVLGEGSSGLAYLAARLKNSGRYQVLRSLSWIQTNPPETSGPALRIVGGTTLTGAGGAQVHALDGSIALYGGHYLHIDAHLQWNQAGGDGNAQTWALDELRRLKLDELHYIDSARLGVLARVTRAD